jgi:N-sulfoglucosamine sulfohydrolase
MFKSTISAVIILVGVLASAGHANDRPNILWITSEDNSCYLGCYGDTQAKTPRLDQLAAEGVRYRNAFANAPVCSTARTTLITGMHASSLGLHNHRSRVAMPESFLLYPQHLRAAGYYCTNNSKEDYNIAGRDTPWDASNNRAHYRNREPGQPFFAVFNSTTTHESKVAAAPNKSDFRIAPDDFILPPYHPDTEVMRRDWSNYYDQMTKLDAEVGDLLDELQRDGLADNTIVFYYSDHGGALPGGKRNIHDVGTRVPMIIRFPEKWAHLSPVPAGQWEDAPVSFVDLPATLLSLCGVPIPDHYEGVAFLGDQKGESQEFVYLFRGRMDERYDSVRAIRNRNFRYVKNYTPHRPYGQHYTYAFTVQPSMRSWFDAFQSGQTDEAQSIYWRPKPAEELYEIAADTYELNNLAGSRDNGEMLETMRRQLHERMIALRDTGFIPEGMYPHLAGERTIYDYAQSDAYEIERVLKIADKATSRDSTYLNELAASLSDANPLIRYWAATGCLVLRDTAAAAKPQLVELLHDPMNDVRVVAAEAVAHLGEGESALAALADVLSSGNTHEVLAAQNAIEYLWVDRLISAEQAKAMFSAKKKWDEPNNRIPAYIAEVKDTDRPRQ